MLRLTRFLLAVLCVLAVLGLVQSQRSCDTYYPKTAGQVCNGTLVGGSKQFQAWSQQADDYCYSQCCTQKGWRGCQYRNTIFQGSQFACWGVATCTSTIDTFNGSWVMMHSF